MGLKKKIIIAGAIFAILLMVGGILYFVIGRALDDEGVMRVPIYFFDAAQGRLDAEFRRLPPERPDDWIKTTLNYLNAGPQSAYLSGVWPVGIDGLVTDFYISDAVLFVMFSDMYTEIPPADEIIFRSAFTKTMVSLPYIESVMIRHPSEGFLPGEGEYIEWLESAATIANSPPISPARRTADQFTLYFVDETGEGLVAKTYVAEGVNQHTRAQHMIQLLIEGQTADGFLDLIPPETRVRNIITEEGAPGSPGIYIDLSGDFHRNFGGTPTQARMMLQSITHTLLVNIRSHHTRVFFLIDSDRRDDFHGVSDFNLGFTIDETIVLEP
ncbi:MAG: GerMN domain-containing protein [Defluviitaleaceae bacterium]|nr:GerMN domain-containing protein [Defluviitaleaceae bacterium]